MRSNSNVLILLTLLGGFLLVPCADAALGDHQWSRGWPVGGVAVAAVDGQEHAVTFGTFFSPLDLGGGTFTPTNIFGGDAFLARYDADGDHVWSQQFTPGGFGLVPDVVTAAPDGSIYLAATLQNGDVDFGGGLLAGNGDVVLAAFEPGGTHRWSFVLGPGTVRGLDASDGTVAVAGYTTGSVDFGGGALSSAGGTDVFLGILEPNGTHRASATFGGAEGQGGMAVAVDAAEGVVVAASTEGPIDFGGGALTPGPLSADLCVAAFDSDGLHQWSALHSGDFNPGAGIGVQCDLAISSAGRIALVGQFQGLADLGGSNLSAFGSDDAFLAVYESDGTHVASRRLGGTSTEGAQGVDFDSDGNVVVAGVFLSAVADFGGAPLNHSGGFGSDWFVTVFDGAGGHLYSEAFTGNGQYFMAADFTASGDLMLHGAGASGTDFGGGPLASTAVFLARFDGAVEATAVAPSMRAPTLAQNQPNPFNPRTIIRFDLPRETEVRLEVIDATGRRLRVLEAGLLSAGEHAVVFDGRDARRRSLASGVYHYRLSTRWSVITRSMVLVR